MRTPCGLRQRGLGVAHAGVELREVHVLHLDRAAAGQLVVQMLPGAAERLPRALRLRPASRSPCGPAVRASSSS